MYNANLINSLLSDSEGFSSSYYQFNPILVPNWKGHLLMSFLLKLLPAIVVEKVLALMLAVALPYSFRALLKTGAAKNGTYFSYLIFPFVYSLTFLLGFYNFTIGLILLFVTQRYWNLNFAAGTNQKHRYAILGVLILILYFSHLLPFLMFYVVVFCSEIASFFKNTTEWKKRLNTLLSIAACSIPALIALLSFIYFRSSVEKEYLFLNFSILIDWIKNFRTLIVFATALESSYTALFSYLFLLLAFLALFQLYRQYSFRKKLLKNQSILLAFYTNLMTFFVLAILYFTLPDNDGVGGEIIPRIQWLMMVYLILTIATIEQPKWLFIPIIATTAFISYNLNNYYYQVKNQASQAVIELMSIEPHLQNKSTLGVFGSSHNWTYNHFSNLLGIVKEIVILKNYEADREYFPIIWNKEHLPEFKIGKLDYAKQVNNSSIASANLGKEESVDYLLLQGGMEKLKNSDLKTEILQDYKLISKKSDYELYANRNSLGH